MSFIFLLALFSLSALAQIDPHATAEAKELYKKLNEVSLSVGGKQEILLGQQNAFQEGRGWRRDNRDLNEELKSDMHDVAGVHPAVLGLDFSGIGSWNKDLLIQQMKEVHNRGGVVTISWHMGTLIDDGKGDNSFSDTTSKVVKHILPGGKAHDLFTNKLNSLADFFLSNHNIPVVFRPWHEHNFSWFWWGNDHCTKEEYIRLWQFTINYLMSKGVHNLLFAYSPNHIDDSYLDRYPGDQYVDILGVDHYFSNPSYDKKVYGPFPLMNWKNDVIWLSQESVKRNKIPAITEFGLESSSYKKFWTDYFGWPLEKEGMNQLGTLPAKAPAYILLWRNDMKDPKHFFGPVPGHHNNDNFKALLSKKIFKGL